MSKRPRPKLRKKGKPQLPPPSPQENERGANCYGKKEKEVLSTEKE